MEGLEGTVLGDFHLVDLIGQGGMTTVYRAVDRTDGREVAIKVLSPYIAQDRRFKDRFEREIEVLHRLSHKHIVPILDYGEEKAFAYIVMPYFPNGTLQDRLEKGPLDPLEGARVVDQVSQALQYAHDLSVVHRDVKPSNILLDDQGDAFLSDFGFAQIGDVSLNLTGSALIGTPAFMSPEQCQGEDIDARSDQYSLGVVLYQLSTGSLPFEGDTPMAIAVKHINERIPRPRVVNPYLPARIEEVLLRALMKDAAKRYSGIAALNSAFQTALSASLDESGNFIPDPRRFEVSTWVMEVSPFASPLSGLSQLWANQRGLTVTILFLMLALPSAAFALSSISPDPSENASSTSSMNAQATIDALSTGIAAEMGSEGNEAAIAAAVAATLNAAMPESERIANLATPTFDLASPTSGEPTLVSGDGVLPNPSPTKKKDGSGSGGNDPAPTPNPSETEVPTGTPTPVPATATITLTTSPVPTTTPSNTPGSSGTVNPNSCNEDPGHQRYCTPTPTPASGP